VANNVLINDANSVKSFFVVPTHIAQGATTNHGNALPLQRTLGQGHPAGRDQKEPLKYKKFWVLWIEEAHFFKTQPSAATKGERCHL